MPGSLPGIKVQLQLAARSFRAYLQIAQRDLNWEQPSGRRVVENFRVAAALLERSDELRCVVD